MYAHGVEVFDGANHHALVFVVAHYLHLKFLPSKQAFLYEDFRHGRCAQPKRDHFFIFFPVVCDSPSCSAQSKAWANNHGEFIPRLNPINGLLHLVDSRALGDVQANFQHGFAEKLAVFAFFDCLLFCAYKLHPVFFEYTAPSQFQG